jgi:predicted TIM-barrel fold metal-dependent hydrolase
MASALPYRIHDADNHFNEPLDVYERYIEPGQRELAVRFVTDASGNGVQLFGGQPSKVDISQVTFSADELARLLGDTSGLATTTGFDRSAATPQTTIPGMLLNRLNPLRGLDDAQRSALVAEFRKQSESYGNRELRLALMDAQGIEAALMFPNTAHDLEYQFADRVDALYANIRAFNRWLHEEVGFAHRDRMFLPPYLALADVELAVKELELVIRQGAPIVQFKAGHAHGGRDNPFGGRSIADPVFDPLWARIDEAGVRVAVHLGATDYGKYGADWSEDPQATLGQFDAFQWVMYWGDRPAMELTAAMILHGLFERFPKLRVCLSEQGTVWVPYLVRKMDHAFLMGRKARWGRLERRPSDVFRAHFVVTPFPEENVQRVVEAVGIDPIVFGSDFPHGEGLAYPDRYAEAQLKGLSAADVRRIMRDNLAGFLGLPAGL